MARRDVRYVLVATALMLGCRDGVLISSLPDSGTDTAGGEKDAGVDQSASDVAGDGAPDAAACGCSLSSDGWTLTMSWDCLCAAYGCAGSKPACGDHRVSYPSCGLTVDSTDTFGGPSLRVYDETGALVGTQYSSDTSDYFCPSDRSLSAARVRAGRFPAPSCAAEACTCADAGSSCAPATDAGQADAGGDAGQDGATSCAGNPVTCGTGTPGGVCSDSNFEPQMCVNGQWTCRTGWFPVSQCGCFPGGLPGCG